MTFRDALQAGRMVLMDGAMGTELIRRGYEGPTWRANLDAPELVAAIHAEYVRAGAEVVLTNSFLLKQAAEFPAPSPPGTPGGEGWGEGGQDPTRNHKVPAGSAPSPPTPLPRSTGGEGNSFPASVTDQMTWNEVGQAAVRLARHSSASWVLGALGPSAAGSNFADLDAVLGCVHSLAGVDGLVLETCSDESALTAVAAIRRRWPDLPVLVSFAFAPGEDEKATSLARLTDRSEIAALGVNCGRDQGVFDIAHTLALFRRETAKPLFARPNAGTPQRDGEMWRYAQAPADWAKAAVALGTSVTLLGGCCGTTPAHIQALRSYCSR